MTELFDGLILSLNNVNDEFTFMGKPIKLEQDKNNPNLYTATQDLSDEEKAAGNNLQSAITLSIGTPEGTVSIRQMPPDTDEFKDLNDAEKLTKLNSIKYQFGAEPTDKGLGLDAVLQTSATTNSTKSSSSSSGKPAQAAAAPQPVVSVKDESNTQATTTNKTLKEQEQKKKE
jgi:hypothetical protein